MRNVIGSKVNLDLHNTFYAIEFFDCVSDLLDVGDVQDLDKFEQHLHTSRLQHSLNVSYYSYLFCKVFHFDYRSAARAGLLHDLFLYDWRDEKREEGEGQVERVEGSHAFAHPKVALKNARKHTNLNEIEQDAIVKHMWPLCGAMPMYKESYMVSLADKYCCMFEVLGALYLKFRGRKRFFAHKGA